MKHIKIFEAFALPGRKPAEIANEAFSEITDEFGEDILIRTYMHDRSFLVMITVKQVLRKTEIEEFIDQYLLAGTKRIENFGFDFMPKHHGLMYRTFLKGKDDMLYKGVEARISYDDTIFYLYFKNELK